MFVRTVSLKSCVNTFFRPAPCKGSCGLAVGRGQLLEEDKRLVSCIYWHVHTLLDASWMHGELAPLQSKYIT